MPKKKKEKIIYYDDNSTVVDMSWTYRNGKPPERRSTAREKMATFFAAMRMMVLPMCCTLVAFGLIYVFLLLITGSFW